MAKGRAAGSAHLQNTPEALRLLLSRLGADRALSRAEIEKLALYASGKGKIEEADVEAAVGDAAELAIDRVVLAAGSGRLEAALNECDRCVPPAARTHRRLSPPCNAIFVRHCTPCAAPSTAGVCSRTLYASSARRCALPA